MSFTLEDEVRLDLDLPRVVCEYVDVFQMSYLDYLHIGMQTSVSSYTLVIHPSL